MAPVPLAAPPPPAKRARLVEPLREGAFRELPENVANAVDAFVGSPRPQFEAFKAKYGGRFPATYDGERFTSGYHPRIPHENLRRFVWKVDVSKGVGAGRYMVAGTAVLVTFKNQKHWQRPIPCNVKDVFSDSMRVVLTGGQDERVYRFASIQCIELYVDVKRCQLGGCARNCHTCCPWERIEAAPR